MRLILTHEQADFDALASLYAASLLYEPAYPVLPHHLNRNVRAFLTLYGHEFGFVEARDLPSQAVDEVILVDSQSLITVRGMSRATRVRIIDHHPRRPSLNPDWDVYIDEIGATTTLLVEGLQEHNGGLTPLQATLLLLGIYEDTGSLTYSRTTPRDAQAVAYLLEQGASLKMAAEFINPPLSEAQRALYDLLVANSETLEIHGHRIVIARGAAIELEEEISSLAHKLRDLFDPDAIFVLVTTREGVRLVARSTSDAINVADILAAFGGGGHERAAAALVRPAEEQAGGVQVLQEQIYQELRALLLRHVRPAVTVGQIMSRQPYLLTPQTSLQEAATLMQRTGFEGFPIVENGKVIGLLTRRAVDRALAHRLNLKITSLMEAGQVTVSPEDSIQTLQARMIESGWGQIPVVDAQSGEIVGIVTRTDLLKVLHLPAPQLRNLKDRLLQVLPPSRRELIRLAAAKATQLNMAIYIVGGFVRDLLLGQPSLDFDLVVEGEAIHLAQALQQEHGGRLTVHSRFGTAKWFLPPSLRGEDAPAFIDLISARTEFYEHPTALPTVVRGSIKLDLHRRDFTINTLAIRLDGRHFGQLLDYWGGLRDLERGLVRVLHSLSFIDDPTRMLRAVRYEQRYRFQIEPRTLQLMNEARPLLVRLSAERVRHEIDLILDETCAVDTLRRLSELGLLETIHPALRWSAEIEQRLARGLAQPVPSEIASLPTLNRLPMRRALAYTVWFFHLEAGEIIALANRLRFAASLKRIVLAASALFHELPSLAGAPPSRWVERLDRLPLLSIYALQVSLPPETVRALAEYLERWRKVFPKTNGELLRQRGLAPGPHYRRILTRLRAAWLDGEIHTDEEERALLEQLLTTSL
ncbi:MAG: CBS domain-containing protein [Anaerolineales bacterium]